MNMKAIFTIMNSTGGLKRLKDLKKLIQTNFHFPWKLQLSGFLAVVREPV